MGEPHEKRIVLGYCEDCGREVSHDQEDAEFCYDRERPSRLEAVFCPECAVARFGALPAGCQTLREAEAFIDRALTGLPARQEARERISAKMQEGRRVTGEDLAELAGITGKDMRGMSAITDAAERLRRYRKVGTPRAPAHTGPCRGPLRLAWDADAPAPGGAEGGPR